MSGDQLNLDDVEARAKDARLAIENADIDMVRRGAAYRLASYDVPALVAEVRRLRDWIDQSCGCV